MKGRTNRLLLAIIVLLLGYIGVSEWRRRQRPPETDETVGRFDLHKVDEVSFTIGTATLMAVREADGRWSLTHPLKEEADGPTILSILSNLKELKIIRSIADPDDLEQYGLTRPRVITLRERGPFGGTRHTYLLGEISPVHYVCPLDYWIYAQRQGEPRVLVVEGYQINHLLPQAPDDLRNRNLLSFNPHDVRKVEVTVGETAYTAVATPEGWMTQGHHGRSPFTYMRQVLFTLANLRAVRAEVREDLDLATLGLDPPVAQVRLYTDQSVPVEVISFGGPYTESGVVYVRRESTRAVYLVSSSILEELRKPSLAQESSRAW
jgi:uncharacterized protein DUF4340